MIMDKYEDDLNYLVNKIFNINDENLTNFKKYLDLKN